MPKIKDLGINIVPGTMRPPEFGGGGGGGGGWSQCNCITGQMDTGPTDCLDCQPQQTFTPFCSNCDCISNDDWGCVCTRRTQRLPSDCNCISNVPCPAATVEQACPAASAGTLITPHTPNLAAGVLTRDDIASLRAELKKSLENLDIAEKNLLPKTVEDVDAREKELHRELDALKARRSELKK